MHAYGALVRKEKDTIATRNGQSLMYQKVLAQLNLFPVLQGYQLNRRKSSTVHDFHSFLWYLFQYSWIDNLHLFLRIMDNLVNLLITDLRRLDGVEKCTSLDLCGAQNLKKYESFLVSACKMNLHFYVCKYTSSLKWCDLTGPEKCTLLSRIDLACLFPNLPNAPNTQKLRKDFSTLNEMIRYDSLSTLEIEAFTTKQNCGLKHVTPYIHALVAHLPEFLTLHGSIIPFMQQSLEWLNDQYTHFSDESCMRQS